MDKIEKLWNNIRSLDKGWLLPDQIMVIVYDNWLEQLSTEMRNANRRFTIEELKELERIEDEIRYEYWMEDMTTPIWK